jgi:hypothetical protein
MNFYFSWKGEGIAELGLPIADLEVHEKGSGFSNKHSGDRRLLIWYWLRR